MTNEERDMQMRVSALMPPCSNSSKSLIGSGLFVCFGGRCRDLWWCRQRSSYRFFGLGSEVVVKLSAIIRRWMDQTSSG